MSVIFYFEEYFGFESLQGRRQVFRLKGLDERSAFANKRFSDLDDVHQRKLKSAVLRAINIRQLNPKGEATSVYHIFERLNTGGTALKPQEIRNCVFRGRFADLLQEWNRDQNWRLLLGKETFDRYQKDVELVLRAFALRFRLEDYEKPMKEFLNTVMKEEQAGTSDRVRIFAREFAETTKVLADVLGSKAFNVRGPLNSAVMDAVVATVAANLGSLPPDLGDRGRLLLEDEEFRKATFYGTSDVAVVKKRFERAREILLSA